MSVYLALHTSAAPSIADIAEFGRLALELGAKPDQPLAVQRGDSGALTAVLPLPETTHPTSPSAQCRGEGRGGAVSEGEGA